MVVQAVEDGALVQEPGGPVMLVRNVGSGWAFCSWFDEHCELRQSSFPVSRLVVVGNQRRRIEEESQAQGSVG